MGTNLKTIPIYLSIVVWGEDYVRGLLNFCLPSLLAPGNIPAIRHRGGSKLILHTQAADAERMEQAPSFQLLRQTIEVEVRLIEVDDVPHTVISRCHRDALGSCDQAGVPAVFLTPDTIWSDGSIAAVDRLLSSGKRVIFLPPCRRIVREDADQALKSLFKGESSVSLNPRTLNEFGFKFLHPTMEEFFFEPGRGTAHLPMMLAWTAPNGDMLLHSFHHHPLMVFPIRRFASFDQTIDGDLVDAACPDPAHHYIVTDSDEITAIELTSGSMFLPGIIAKDDPDAVASWALGAANRTHWRLVRHPVRIHAHPIDAAAWAPVEGRAAAVVNGLFAYRRRRMAAVLWNNLSCWAVKKAFGMSRPEAREWLFRRRQDIAFRLHEVFYRGWHDLSFPVRHWWAHHPIWHAKVVAVELAVRTAKTVIGPARARSWRSNLSRATRTNPRTLSRDRARQTEDLA